MGTKKTEIKKSKNKHKRINKFKLFLLLCLFLVVFISGFLTYKFFSFAKNVNEDEHINVSKTKIFIDASFGGLENGYTTKNGTKAKDVTLSIANKISDELSKYDDIEVVMSRTKDVGLTCDERVKLINESNSKLAVSIRVNGQSEEFTANGLQCYVNNKKELYKDSSNLANIVQKMISNYVKIRKRFFIDTDFDILKNSKIPSIIILTGFLTTPSEEKNLINEDYQNELAIGVAQGILTYIDSN